MQAIFERTYGAVKRKEFMPPKPPRRPAADNSEEKRRELKKAFSGEDYLLVDGYNIIFAWDELKKAAAENCDIVLYGHTHLAKIEYREERYFLNPGSLRQPMEGHPSYIELNLDDKNVVPILVEL
mgnify:CR=1 FL=1